MTIVTRSLIASFSKTRASGTAEDLQATLSRAWAWPRLPLAATEAVGIIPVFVTRTFPRSSYRQNVMAITFRNFRLWQDVVGLEVGFTNLQVCPTAPPISVAGLFS